MNYMYLSLNQIIFFFLILQSCYGQIQVRGTQIAKYREHDTATIKITPQNVPQATSLILYFLNGNRASAEFTLSLNRNYNGSTLVGILCKGGKVFQMKPIVQFLLDGNAENGSIRHPCFSACEIIINDWTVDKRTSVMNDNILNACDNEKGVIQFSEALIIKYNLNDVISAKVKIKNVPRNVATITTHHMGDFNHTIINENPFKIEKRLTDEENQQKFYLELFNEEYTLVGRLDLLRYQLVNELIADSNKHPCLSHCEIILDYKILASKNDTKNVDKLPEHIVHNTLNIIYSTLTVIPITQPTSRPTTNSFSTVCDTTTEMTDQSTTLPQNASEDTTILYIAICVVAAIAGIIILLTIIYFRCKKSRNTYNEQEAYSYVTQNQLVYTQVLHDTPKMEAPKNNYITAYSRIIGVLKQQ